MPTVLKSGPYRFFFYAGDYGESAHIHVERDNNIAKFWLDPIRLHNSGGFSRIEIAKLFKIIGNNHTTLLEAWNEYFSS
jgi:hypothetical protein